MLLTRTPLYSGLPLFAFDLHVLGTPPALILSQDQTLSYYFLLLRSAPVLILNLFILHQYLTDLSLLFGLLSKLDVSSLTYPVFKHRGFA